MDGEMTAPTPNPPPGNLWVGLYFDFKDLIVSLLEPPPQNRLPLMVGIGD